MAGMKQEPGMSTRRRTMPLRANTPISLDSASEVRCAGHTQAADTAASSSSSTDATFPGTDSEMPDVTTTYETTPDPLERFGSKGRELIERMQELQCLGINTTLGPLPKVACIGDQSAGKSSIIEAVTDISLPRSEGTCTKCPFRITTHASQEGDLQWKCTISLQYSYHYLPGHTDHDAGFLDWVSHGQVQMSEFTTITSKSELELNLRRAQVAILNPAKNWRNCVKLGAAEVDRATFEVDFSPNVICLEITAPRLLEMSFYDLPGAINIKEKETDDSQPEFVKALLRKYINDEKALIVIACPANQDFHNGLAFKYLREYKATARAIGVLTKPDLIEGLTSKPLTAFEKMFSGEHFWVAGGWFMTRQLSQTQLNGPKRPSYEQARAQEAQFFSQHPWSTDLAAYADRFGITNLQEAISRKHIQHILASLPDIVERVQRRLAEVQQQLEEYPRKAANPGLAVIYDVDRVVQAIVAQCSVDSKHSRFRGAQTVSLKQLKKQLAGAAPKVDLSTPGHVKPTINLFDTDEEMDDSPSKRVRGDDGRAYSVTPRRPTSVAPARAPASASSKRKATQPFPANQDNGVLPVTFRLDDVKKRFDLAPSAQLPDDADRRITHDMAREAVGGFSVLTQHTLEKFEVSVTNMFNECLTEALATRKGTLLYEEVASIMRTLFEELFGKETDTIHHYISCLTHRPITFGKDWWDSKRSEYCQKLLQGRTEARVLERYEKMEDEGFKVPPAIEDRKKKANDPAFVAGCRSPAFERELKELAMPLTFYELTSGHLVDTVARSLDYLIYQIEDRIKTRLLEKLQPYDSVRSATLLAEDPKREEKRAALEAEQQKLEHALEKLERLSSTVNCPT